MKYTLALPLLFLLSSCFDAPECQVSNTVFLNHTPEQIQYKTEVARLIDSIGIRNVGIWIKGYKAEGDKEYVITDLRQEKICATGVFEITENENLKNFRKVRGRSYSGAAILGMEYHVQKTQDGSFIIFDNAEAILD